MIKYLRSLTALGFAFGSGACGVGIDRRRIVGWRGGGRR